MEKSIYEWNLKSKEIKRKYNIEIQIGETGGGELVFTLNTPIEKRWLIDIIKANFFASDENITFVPMDDCTFKIEARHNPKLLHNGFSIENEKFPAPKESDRINFKKLEENEKNFKPDDHEFFQILKENYPDQKPSTNQGIFVDRKPPGFGEITNTTNVPNDETEILPKKIKYSNPKTWEQYFLNFGFTVKVIPKISTDDKSGGKIIGNNIEFSSVKELNKFVNESRLFSKKYNFCEVQNKPQLFTSWPQPIHE